MKQNLIKTDTGARELPCEKTLSPFTICVPTAEIINIEREIPNKKKKIIIDFITALKIGQGANIARSYYLLFAECRSVAFHHTLQLQIYHFGWCAHGNKK